MKPNVKQKQPVVQLAINNALAGGGAEGNVPTPGVDDGGKVLTASSDSTFSWQEVDSVPSPEAADLGKILLAAGAGTYGWVDVLKGASFGSNYIEINGIKIYVSATTPTGDIPDGSIWIGG